MAIHNAILTKTNKEPKLEKLNDESDPIFHIQGFEYNIEVKYGVNYYLKANYFLMSLTGEVQK